MGGCLGGGGLLLPVNSGGGLSVQAVCLCLPGSNTDDCMTVHDWSEM